MDGWKRLSLNLVSEYTQLSDLAFSILYAGCIFINTTSLQNMPWHDAYQFCYNLDPRARLVEIHNPEQLDFLNILLSKNLLIFN